ncbi:hypothetical protein [Arthrobacter sp. Soil736]|jgi:hypothetical protein|nr:hypothetical protein [Arthrobacter sp. Soil736]
MMIWNSLTLFLDSHRYDRHEFGGAGSEFPSGQLTSTAWAGWWHDEA